MNTDRSFCEAGGSAGTQVLKEFDSPLGTRERIILKNTCFRLVKYHVLIRAIKKMKPNPQKHLVSVAIILGVSAFVFLGRVYVLQI